MSLMPMCDLEYIFLICLYCVDLCIMSFDLMIIPTCYSGQPITLTVLCIDTTSLVGSPVYGNKCRIR